MPVNVQVCQASETNLRYRSAVVTRSTISVSVLKCQCAVLWQHTFTVSTSPSPRILVAAGVVVVSAMIVQVVSLLLHCCFRQVLGDESAERRPLTTAADGVSSLWHEIMTGYGDLHDYYTCSQAV